MANIRDVLLTVGKVSASVVLNTFLPGSGGIIQLVEDMLGPKTGDEKKKLAVTMASTILDSLAKAGKLDAAAPSAADVAQVVQATLDNMKANGVLEQAGLMSINGLKYRVTVIGLLPE